MNKKKIVVIGGGNVGIVVSAILASEGDCVTLLTRHPECWQNTVSAEVEGTAQIYRGQLERVTSDASCVRDADLILVCLPGFVMKPVFEGIHRYLKLGTPVCSVFSCDGFFFVAQDVFGRNWPLLGFERIPYIARTKTPYRVGCIKGSRPLFRLAHLNCNGCQWCEYFTSRFHVPTVPLDNYWLAALASSNLVTHPARLMSLRNHIKNHGAYTSNPRFYEEWDDMASKYAIALDCELRLVAKAKGADLVPYLTYWESTDEKSLTRKIKSVGALKGIASPITAEGLLDFSSRYIQSDVKFALRMVRDLARDENIETPVMDEVIAAFCVTIP